MNEKVNNEAFLEVVYNGNKTPLTREETIALSQKGMNYDKLYERAKNLQSENEKLMKLNQKIEKIADELQLSPSELIEGLEEEKVKEEIILYSKENDIPYEYAKKIKDMEGKIKLLEKEKNELIPLKERKEELSEFKKLYPDVDERELDPEILKAWEEGKRPLKDIYNEVTLQKLLKEKEAKKVNEENKNASSGSAIGAPEGEEEFTDEIIRNMSDKEFNRNFSKILKQYKKGER